MTNRWPLCVAFASCSHPAHLRRPALASTTAPWRNNSSGGESSEGSMTGPTSPTFVGGQLGLMPQPRTAAYRTPSDHLLLMQGRSFAVDEFGQPRPPVVRTGGGHDRTLQDDVVVILGFRPVQTRISLHVTRREAEPDDVDEEPENDPRDERIQQSSRITKRRRRCLSRTITSAGPT
jgi:hypothetical protein